MISTSLLKILCCPETYQSLSVLDDGSRDQLNGKIRDRKLLDRSGKVVEMEMDGALVREDRKFVYPVRSDIPVLLIDEAIPL